MKVIFIIVLPFLISIAIFLVTQKFFPVRDSTITQKEFTKKIKSFWSILIFLVSFIMTTSITLVYEIYQKFGTLTHNIDCKYGIIDENIGNVNKKIEFQELFNAYAAISNPIVKQYAKEQIEKVKDDFRQEMVDISTFSTPELVADFYDAAKECIIATNVGDINFFLHNDKYKRQNQRMYEKGIPVIRFFIYHKDINGNFEDFKKQAFAVHENLNTVCSIIIDPNDPATKTSVLERMRDIIIIDATILSETKMLSNGKFTDEANLTCNERKIKEAYKYLSILYNFVNKSENNNTIHFMDDKKVKSKYGKYMHDNGISTNRELAKAILEKAIYQK